MESPAKDSKIRTFLYFQADPHKRRSYRIDTSVFFALVQSTSIMIPNPKPPCFVRLFITSTHVFHATENTSQICFGLSMGKADQAIHTIRTYHAPAGTLSLPSPSRQGSLPESFAPAAIRRCRFRYRCDTARRRRAA